MTKFACIAALALSMLPALATQEMAIIAPPESFFQIVRERDREPARAFYHKYLDADGLPVVAAAEVEDEALRRVREMVLHLLASRPDVLSAMVKDQMYLIVIGRDQLYTQMPEYRYSRNPAYQNERVRGTGGKPTSFGEENILSLPIDRYDDESIALHEFCHTIDSALESMDPEWATRRAETYRQALEKGLFAGTYAGSNEYEYWAEICQSYFDCNRVNNWNHGPIGTREQLKEYDPAGYELVCSAFKLTPKTDWRFPWMAKTPAVIPPPAKFAIDPFYTKFTWAREMPVLGRNASDAALLKANDTIRKLFAYRHDVLKALIADGVRLVVLAPDETIADLPEFSKQTDASGFDPLARFMDYDARSKLLVVAEENVLADPGKPMIGDSQIIRVFAKATLSVLGSRPVDPKHQNKGMNAQQYELGLTRLDERFGARVKGLYDTAVATGKWKRNSAIHSPSHYWAAGVLAYFDASGQDGVPAGSTHPINTRERLREYDPELFELVRETMAYELHVDWRFSPQTQPISR